MAYVPQRRLQSQAAAHGVIGVVDQQIKRLSVLLAHQTADLDIDVFHPHRPVDAAFLHEKLHDPMQGMALEDAFGALQQAVRPLHGQKPRAAMAGQQGRAVLKLRQNLSLHRFGLQPHHGGASGGRGSVPFGGRLHLQAEQVVKIDVQPAVAVKHPEQLPAVAHIPAKPIPIAGGEA